MGKIIKVGSKVECNHGIAKIKAIEICKPGEKYGTAVSECNLSVHKHGVVDLDNQHWCYFDEIYNVL